MGKRKERRFAANNTSRRVKLDLFAEPSGDLGGSDVRSDGDEKEQTEPNELPKSPSSSGQKTENPLLLLGQYSDEEEEVEDEKEDKADDATAESSLANKNEKVEAHKDTNVKSGADTTMQMVDQQQTGEDPSASYYMAEGGSGYVTASNSTAADGLTKQIDPSVQASATVSLEQYALMDVTSQWKMILHEESNQYYYWNTLTGETSWEIPAVLSQTATAYGTGYHESGPMVTDAYNLSSGVEPSYLQQPVENVYTGTDCSTSLTAQPGEGNKSEDHYAKSFGTDGHQVECQIDSAVNYQPSQEELAGPRNSDHVQATAVQVSATDLPFRLLSQSEGLLEKLRSLKKSHGNFHSNEQISKYILELEVRHSDVKALLNDASPLLSFWLHTEKELKRLEDGVNDEIYELAKSAVMDGIAETNNSSPEEKLVTDDNTASETHDSGREGELAQSGKTLHSDESVDGDGSPTRSQSHPADKSDNVTPLDEIQKVGSSVVEDVDMDVDMEVEESVSLSPAQVIDASDTSNLHADVPPPPGEEWVPPPPSEVEDVPPPPPDSFSEPVPPPPLENDHALPPLSSDSVGVPYTVPQSYIQQSADYAAQYNLSYPESSYQYITNAVAPNTQFYGQVDGSQVSLPQSAYYYETVPGTSEVAPFEAYYNLNGVAPLFPVSAEASLNHGGVGSASYNIPSDSSKAVEPSSKSNDSAEAASLGIATQSTDGSSQLAKGQSKVKRPKKRTVSATTSTLRSNKKVSSLVDKWKAAKEELNDSEEEEEEDDYGVLDRKRRREIEEWKSRQIASGEAKDNANFQPLGGDWREKVKRRKERTGREADEPKKKDEKQQKPDLTKLSAHLPSGWQAYWDESTKKTYYGNTVTSETSWTRPTTNN
ncbi:formin-binding protein 4 isoform X1 [Brassica napus]|uniref:formin-binding protein 4 isoform X1 n=1 Tax=Brassica napus TaxID=3708 RepID=UPI002078ECED|nr:formin-binding protein 4 isoform X1 [Brassica napus]